MFDIGWSEMAVVAFLALMIIGPKELPRVLRTVGHWVRKAQSLAREFQSGLDDMVREADLEDAKKLVDTGRNLNVNKILEETVDPTGSVRKEAESLQKDVQADKPAKESADGAAESKTDGAAAAAESPPDGEAAPKATVVRHPLRVAPSDSITPPPEPETKPKAKAKPRAKPKPKSEPETKSAPSPKPKSSPKPRSASKPKTSPVPVAEDVAAAPADDGSQKTA